jgi:hypothetical protein
MRTFSPVADPARCTQTMIQVSLVAARAASSIQRQLDGLAAGGTDMLNVEAGLQLLSLVKWLDQATWMQDPGQATRHFEEVQLLERAAVHLYGQNQSMTELVKLGTRSKGFDIKQAKADPRSHDLLAFFSTLNRISLAG